MKKQQTTRTLERLLNMLPIMNANPGITLAELGRISGFEDRAQLREYLEKLMLVGTPPFSPGDLIEIYIDEQDRVEMVFPKGLDRPIALSPAEWTAVQGVLARELEFQPIGHGTGSQLREILGQLSDVPVAYDSASPFQNKSTLVEEALGDGLQIEFKYRTLASKEPEIRRVDPWALFQHRKVAYLIAYCHLRRDARYFHLERMDNIEILEAPQTSTPPDNLDEFMRQSPIFQLDPTGFTVELAFDPELRFALELYFKIHDAAPYQVDGAHSAGWFRAKCKVQESIWFRSMLRSLGPQVRVLAPEHLRQSFLEELKSIPIPELIPGEAS